MKARQKVIQRCSNCERDNAADGSTLKMYHLIKLRGLICSECIAMYHYMLHMDDNKTERYPVIEMEPT